VKLSFGPLDRPNHCKLQATLQATRARAERRGVKVDIHCGADKERSLTQCQIGGIVLNRLVCLLAGQRWLLSARSAAAVSLTPFGMLSLQPLEDRPWIALACQAPHVRYQAGSVMECTVWACSVPELTHWQRGCTGEPPSLWYQLACSQPRRPHPVRSRPRLIHSRMEHITPGEQRELRVVVSQHSLSCRHHIRS
jgi:hypothetical protein